MYLPHGEFRLALPLSVREQTWYLLIFTTAEAAFIVMSTKEYLQDLLGLTEAELLRGTKREKGQPRGLSPQALAPNREKWLRGGI